MSFYTWRRVSGPFRAAAGAGAVCWHLRLRLWSLSRHHLWNHTDPCERLLNCKLRRWVTVQPLRGTRAALTFPIGKQKDRHCGERACAVLGCGA